MSLLEHGLHEHLELYLQLEHVRSQDPSGVKGVEQQHVANEFKQDEQEEEIVDAETEIEDEDLAQNLKDLCGEVPKEEGHPDQQAASGEEAVEDTLEEDRQELQEIKQELKDIEDGNDLEQGRVRRKRR